MIAIYKEPNKRPEIINIDNTLTAMQEAVGGYIETITFATDACIICNRDGLFSDMRFNCRLLNMQFFGPILIVGAKGDEFTDLKRPECVARSFFGDGCT